MKSAGALGGLMEELIMWSTRGQEICHIAATGVHAVHPILPGPGKEFWPVYRFPRLSKNFIVLKFIITEFIHNMVYKLHFTFFLLDISMCR
jgi:hypothetical protein